MFYIKRNIKILHGLLIVTMVTVFIYGSFFLNNTTSIIFMALTFNKTPQENVIIFNTNHWLVLFNTRYYKQPSDFPNDCEVPKKLKNLSDLFRTEYSLLKYERLPCDMLYSDRASFQEIKCYRGGRYQQRWLGPNENKNESYISCQITHSLDQLLLNKKTRIYPSLIVEGTEQVSLKLFREILHQYYRSPESIWGLHINYESLSYYPAAGDPERLRLFNITSGYNRRLHDVILPSYIFGRGGNIVPGQSRMTLETAMNLKKPILSNATPSQYWPNKNNVSSVTMFNDKSFVKAPILWINSNCNALSNRTEYMTELMKYIDVDNFGNCGPNQKRIPAQIIEIHQAQFPHWTKEKVYRSAEVKIFMARDYLFTIAIENSIAEDYVSEKLWESFVAGSIPIYLGAPNIDDWLPCEKDCIIDLRKFATPKDAAAYIYQVSTNKTLYESFHRWRSEPIHPRIEKILDYFKKSYDYNIQCLVCDMSHRARAKQSLEVFKKEIKDRIGTI